MISLKKAGETSNEDEKSEREDEDEKAQRSLRRDRRGHLPIPPGSGRRPVIIDLLPNYRKRGSASYIVREVLSVRERERERERDTERERERERERETEVTSPLSR